MPYILEHLPPRPVVDDVRRHLNAVCGHLEHTDLQIDMCRQLAQLGVDPALVSASIAQLQEERIVVCSECKSEVQMRDFELHLRRAHQIFQFRGVRNTYADIREAMLKAVCTAPADLAAWNSLQSLAADKHPQETDRFLVAWLYQFVKEGDAEQRATIMTAVAEVLVASGSADRLLPVFVGPSKNASWELLGQHIALELCGRLPGPVPSKLLPLFLPLLDHKDLPKRSRENAALAILRSLGKDNALAADVLRHMSLSRARSAGSKNCSNSNSVSGIRPPSIW